MQFLKRLFSPTTEEDLKFEINSLQDRLAQTERENEHLKARLSTQPLAPNKRWGAYKELSNGSPNYLVRKYLKETASKNGAHFTRKQKITTNISFYPNSVQEMLLSCGNWNNVVCRVLFELDVIHEAAVAALLSEINGKEYASKYIESITSVSTSISKGIYRYIKVNNLDV